MIGKRLSEICAFIRGVTFDKADVINTPRPDYLPILRAGNINGDLDTRNDLVWVPAQNVANEQRLKENDIVICMSSGSTEVVGKTARVRSDYVGSIGSFCGIIRPKDPEIGAWLSYFFQSDLFREHRDAIARGANIQNLRFSQLENIEIPITPGKKRIARILEKADRLRRTRRYAHQLSDTFLQSVFLEMFGDFDREPERWKRVEFDELCKISDDSVDPTNSAFAELPQISSEDIESGSGELRELRTAREKGVISVNFLVQPSEIVFSKIRPNLRKVAYPQMKALCSADIYPLRVVHPECDLCYILFYLRGDSFSRVVTRIAESRSNIPKVNRDELSQLLIPVPPLPLQQKFAAIVRRFGRLRAQQREAERQSEHLFQTLLHRAFNVEL
jgi:type I restriction enzyme, S subunit